MTSYPFPSHVDPVERKIIGALLLLISKHEDIRVAVDDETDVVVPYTSDMATVARSVETTGSTYLRLKDAAGPLGTIMLIQGNGEDVISEMGWPAGRPDAQARLDGFVRHAQHYGGVRA
jgi:hypothetical protein